MPLSARAIAAFTAVCKRMGMKLDYSRSEPIEEPERAPLHPRIAAQRQRAEDDRALQDLADIVDGRKSVEDLVRDGK